MEKILSIFLVFLLFHKANAQIVFCPPGTEWHYSFSWEGSPIYNDQIKYERDSVIAGDIVKVLLHDRYYKTSNFGYNKITVLKQKGDTVFMRNFTTEQDWQILYNFSALPGQSWINNISTTNPNSPSPIPTPTITYTVTVNSVNNINVNSLNLRQLNVTYSSFSYPNYSSILRVENAEITERIGCSQFLFNFYNIQWASDPDYFSDLLCYKDSTFGLKQFTDKPCNYVDYVGIKENNYQNTNIKIYPNPTNNFFTISTENEFINGESIVSIKDLCGREIKQVKLNNLNSEPGKVDISDLANGVYILSLSNNNELVYTMKLVKQD